VSIWWFTRVLHLVTLLVYLQDRFRVLVLRLGLSLVCSALSVFKGGGWCWLFGSVTPVKSLVLSYILLLESDHDLVIYPTDKVPFTGVYKSLFKVYNLLV
jgi:hypothetical protein